MNYGQCVDTTDNSSIRNLPRDLIVKFLIDNVTTRLGRSHGFVKKRLSSLKPSFWLCGKCIVGQSSAKFDKVDKFSKQAI